MSLIEKLVGITAQHNEIVKRIGNGSLNPDEVRKVLQDIIEKRFSGSVQTSAWQPPAWWRTPEQQLEHAHQLWPGLDLPEPPVDFVPSTKTEVLLLHVPDTFDALWSKVVAPAGYTTWRLPEFNSDKGTLRLAKNVREHKVAIWLGFDPEHGKGMRPNELWGQANLAASEVLSALIQFPDWSLTWFKGASAPNLSGYQYKAGADWTLCPCVYRDVDSRQVRLHAYWADGVSQNFSAPAVRKC